MVNLLEERVSRAEQDLRGMGRERRYSKRPEEVEPVGGELLEPVDRVFLNVHRRHIEQDDEQDPDNVEQPDGDRQHRRSVPTENG